METVRPPCHFLFSLRINLPDIGYEEASNLEVAREDDLPPDAKDVRPVREGSFIYENLSDHSLVVHHHAGKRNERTFHGFSWTTTADIFPPGVKIS